MKEEEWATFLLVLQKFASIKSAIFKKVWHQLKPSVKSQLLMYMMCMCIIVCMELELFNIRKKLWNAL